MQILKTSLVPNHEKDVIEVIKTNLGTFDITWYFNNGAMTDWDRWEMSESDALGIYEDVLSGVSGTPAEFQEICAQHGT
jgi:hypothetical protein